MSQERTTQQRSRGSTGSWLPLTHARAIQPETTLHPSSIKGNENPPPSSRDSLAISIECCDAGISATGTRNSSADHAAVGSALQESSDDSSSSQAESKTDERAPEIIRVKKLPFYHGGVRPRHVKIVRFIGRCGFVAKGVVYGIIGVLILTNVAGTWTPNGSQGNESPQGAFLLLGGIPAIGRPILVVMAVGLVTYLVWRFWEAITGQAFDAMLSKRTNFFRYRLSPIVSGCVYCGYLYYVIQMIYQTSEEQQKTASSNEFPASWTDTTVGSAFIGVFAVAFMIAFVTQIQNAVTGNFIPDLRTSAPGARRWEALAAHLSGRIGFGGRAAMFGTLSGFFWDSLAKRNESGHVNVVAAAIAKLATHDGGKAFMVILGLGLIIYGLFAIANAYYKYFPTPPPSRINMYQLIGSEQMKQPPPPAGTRDSDKNARWWHNLWNKHHRIQQQQRNSNAKEDARTPSQDNAETSRTPPHPACEMTAVSTTSTAAAAIG